MFEDDFTPEAFAFTVTPQFDLGHAEDLVLETRQEELQSLLKSVTEVGEEKYIHSLSSVTPTLYLS